MVIIHQQQLGHESSPACGCHGTDCLVDQECEQGTTSAASLFHTSSIAEKEQAPGHGVAIIRPFKSIVNWTTWNNSVSLDFEFWQI